jgi:hypothetical protein
VLLDQIDEAMRNTAHFAVDQHGLLPVEFTTRQKLLPPMRLDG